MKILSFDTSTRSIQTCLLAGREPVYEKVLEPSGAQRQESASFLLPELNEALTAVGWNKSDVDFVVVGAGPGSFTGIRVGMVVARTLGQGLNIGVVPICSLDILALALKVDCTIVMPAGAGLYYGANYRMEEANGHGLPQAVEAPFCAHLPEVLSRSGTGKIAAAPEMLDLIPVERERLAWPEINNIATASAVLAHDRLSLCHGPAADFRRVVLQEYPWQSATPLYLRSPSVTLKTYGNSTQANEPH